MDPLWLFLLRKVILTSSWSFNVESAPESIFLATKALSLTKNKSLKKLFVNLGVFVSWWQLHYFGLSSEDHILILSPARVIMINSFYCELSLNVKFLTLIM
jgi:hypothetical protein